MKAIILFFLMIGPAFAVTQDDRQELLRARQTEACQGDAMNLCGPVIPDEQKVAACLVQQMPRLSPACRAMFGPQRRHH